MARYYCYRFACTHSNVIFAASHSSLVPSCYNDKMNLNDPVSSLPLVGPSYATRLERLNVYTIRDLLHHYPIRYQDYSLNTSINQAQSGETVTISGVVERSETVHTRRRGFTLQNIRVRDQSGAVDVTWFNQPYLINTLRPQTSVYISGLVEIHGRTIKMQSPEYELASLGRQIHTGRLVPIYPETKGLSSKWIRNRIYSLLTKIEIADHLPEHMRTKLNLVELKLALQEIHFPSSKIRMNEAQARLAFDEVLLTQLISQLRLRSWKAERFSEQIMKQSYKKTLRRFITQLPFTLTAAQMNAVDEILEDLSQTTPMNRLLQGDVGSGKTVVAAIGMYVASLSGHQSLLMAPTEILAQQHYHSLRTLFRETRVRVALVTASVKHPTQKADIIVGTHALINKQDFTRVALVIVDEQHRFGVEQRAKLQNKGTNSHLLTMTATPIPRSVALVLHSELSLSYLDELPKGRKPIKTWFVPNIKRASAYQWISTQIKSKGAQAFIVCPLIEESSHETMQSVRAASEEFAKLQKTVFPTLKLGLLHGRMKSKEKEHVLKAFKEKSLDILVSTPVVEVGVDIPSATIMVIEAADRFGLAQLHQLRGRVGRSNVQSYCLLFSESESLSTRKRLRSLETMTNGAALAELDLRLRGPGQLYGIAQHGFHGFKLASFTDRPLHIRAKQVAIDILNQDETLSEFPILQDLIKKDTIRNIQPN